MTAVREGRHLAAIMFVDMVGYSARMQESEPRAIAAVRALWDRVRPILAAHGGREVDLAGDGMLMEFPGALAAVRCAQEIQATEHARNQALPAAERVLTRAGVHLGDIEHRDGRIYGDGINIAARLLPLAPTGALVMSPHVRDQLANVLERPLQSLGSRRLKNIKAPIELWCLPGPDCAPGDLDAARRAGAPAATQQWTFANARLNERTLEFTVRGTPANLDRASLDALLHLLRHAGEVVTRDELGEAMSPGRTADPAALDAAIARLRAALGDAGETVICTVHGFGYRLAAPVTVELIADEGIAHFDFKPGDRPPLRPMWSLLAHLGAGGHGEAWLAQHDKTREQRVFKFAIEAQSLASLKREITLFRVLKDALGSRRDYVHILDWNLAEMPYFIECEHVSGGNLAQWLDRHGGTAALPLPRRLELVAEIADAVSAAHSVGVLHKDLKPSNVLIDESGAEPHVKLCDFGSGGVLDPGRLEQLGITRMGFTKTVLDNSGTTSGTPLYLAPEVISGQPFTAAADTYALGVILYQVLVGDLHKPLAPGWELEIGDELLREDIAAAAHGNPALRLPDASVLARRLRTLEERRTRRAEQREAQARAEKAAQVRQEMKRLRAFAAVTLVLAVGAAAAGVFALKARDQARDAAYTTQVVNDFLNHSVLGNANPDNGPVRDLTMAALLKKAAADIPSSLEDRPEIAARLHDSIGTALHQMGEDVAAVPHLTEASRLYRAVYGDDAPQNDAVNAALVSALIQARAHQKACELAEQVLGSNRSKADPTRPAALQARLSLALCQRMKGETEQALAEFRSIGALVQQSHPDDKEMVYRSKLGVAACLVELARAAESIEAANDLVAYSEKAYGPHHHRTAEARYRLSDAYATLNRNDDATRELEKAVADLEAWLGPASSRVADRKIVLADRYDTVGRYDEAEPIVREYLASSDQHSTAPLLSAWNNLALLDRVRGRCGNLDHDLEQAQAVQKTSTFPEYWYISQVRLQRVLCRVQEGKAAVARADVEAMRKALDGVSVETDLPYYQMLWLAEGETLRLERQRAKAVEVLRQAVTKLDATDDTRFARELRAALARAEKPA